MIASLDPTLGTWQPAARTMAARYDAAGLNDRNKNHWSEADSLAADAALSSDVRQIIRDRCRYEIANNGYAGGIGQTLVNDVIGTGPRLQILGESNEQNEQIEQLWNQWSRRINLAALLRTQRFARFESGESFLVLGTTDNMPGPVKLTLRLYEADHITTPPGKHWKPHDPRTYQDGIQYDASGRAKHYDILQEHPGSLRSITPLDEHDTLPADMVIHDYRATRPGQLRGLSELASVLELFAQLRRYTSATLNAAEIAAQLALYMKTTMPPGGEAASVNLENAWQIKSGEVVFVPEGWEPFQLKAEQPTNTYAQFKRELLNEIARPLSMPYNIAACDSSGYNFASGQLDHLTYDRAIQVDRQHVEIITLDRIFAEFLKLITLDQLADAGEDVPHAWFWRGRPHANPVDDAQAAAVRLENDLSTLSEEYARKGLDWEEQIKQIARERQFKDDLGLSPTAPAPPAPPEASEDPEDNPPQGRQDEDADPASSD